MEKNLYEDALETFSYEEMLNGLSGIGAETGRLELKRELIGFPKLAHIACALANADGGIIAIGIEEHAIASAMKVHARVDTSDALRMSLTSAINARVYPPPPLEMFSYDNGDNSFLIVRVGRSFVAPHEYVAADNSTNLPVKRGSATGRLTLGEIDALRARSQNVYAESPLKERQDWITLNQWGVGPDFMIGMVIEPAAFLRERRTLDVDDDRFFLEVAAASSGIGGVVHEDLSLKVRMDSSWLSTPVSNGAGALGARQPEQQIEIASDGRIIVKLLELDQPNLWSLYLSVLAMGYVTAQKVYRAFGITPRVRMHVSLRLSANAREQKLAQGYSDYFPADLATQPFADTFLSTTMRMMRVADQNSKKDAVRKQILQAFVDKNLPIADELQKRWLA